MKLSWAARTTVPPATNRCLWIVAGVIVLLLGLPAFSDKAGGQVKFTEEAGALPDGMMYLIRVPVTWNRTLIRDLDYAASPDSPRSVYLLEKGYALAGTRRHELRRFQYDPAREIANLDGVLDRFEARFGKPGRVIQFGCSGGGVVALAMAEEFPARIDGAIAAAAHTPVWLMNTFLDGWFALKALINPDLEVGGGQGNELVITNLSNDPAVADRTTAAWRGAIGAAQQTPKGRARIALAFTIGQWPAWTNMLTPEPNLEDVAALQHSMYHAVFQNASNPGGQSRVMFENAAHGQQLSWNTGLDYRELFENGNQSFKAAVHQLYLEAGLDLEADLRRISAFPRISASPYALEFWKAPGRSPRGNPKIPVLRLHQTGDNAAPMSLVQGYETQVHAYGKAAMFRSAYVHGAGHCDFTVAESAAAIETMMRRLDTGNWARTDPDHLNALAASLGTKDKARFGPIDKFRQVKYNRVWSPE
jgi:pimeloyl-ACP methyl ester carboxylesterase